MGNGSKQKTELKVPTLVFSRIVGYLTPVDGWNDGKKQEFADRRVYAVDTNNLPQPTRQPQRAPLTFEVGAK